jgi:hypothetical protein
MRSCQKSLDVRSSGSGERIGQSESNRPEGPVRRRRCSVGSRDVVRSCSQPGTSYDGIGKRGSAMQLPLFFDDDVPPFAARLAPALQDLARISHRRGSETAGEAIPRVVLRGVWCSVARLDPQFPPVACLRAVEGAAASRDVGESAPRSPDLFTGPTVRCQSYTGSQHNNGNAGGGKPVSFA